MNTPDAALPKEVGVNVNGVRFCEHCGAMPLSEAGFFLYVPHTDEAPPPSDAAPVATQAFCPFTCSSKCSIKQIDCLYGLTAVAVPEGCPLPIVVSSERGYSEGFEGPIDTISLGYAHPEDAPLKQTPGNINESGDVKGNLQDAPGGPWRIEIIDGEPDCWQVADGKRRVNGYIYAQIEPFTKAEAIAVRDALNKVDRLKGEKDG